MIGRQNLPKNKLGGILYSRLNIYFLNYASSKKTPY